MGLCVRNEKYPPKEHGLLVSALHTMNRIWQKGKKTNHEHEKQQQQRKQIKSISKNNSEKNTDAKKKEARRSGQQFQAIK